MCIITMLDGDNVNDDVDDEGGEDHDVNYDDDDNLCGDDG